MSSRHFILFVLVLVQTVASGQSLYFPPTSGSEWETISPESLGWCTEKIPELIDFLEEGNTKAFIILKDGKIVMEEYFDNHDQNKFWYWASAGKTLTSFAVGLAEEEGLLNLDDPTSTYLGEGWTSLTKEQEDEIKIIHQLTMTSGLDDGSGDPYCTDPECLTFKAPAGDRWAYHNGPYTLLDQVIEGASGTNLNGFIQSRIKDPTGMKGLFIKAGYNNVYWSDARSMARFGLMVSNDGKWDEEVVMNNQEFIQDMRNTSQDLNPSYGYLWWLNGKDKYLLPGLQIPFNGSISPAAPDDMVSGLGKDGQFLNIVPSEGLVVVRMGQAPDNDLVPIVYLNDMWEHLTDIMCLSTSVSTPTSTDQTIFPNPVSDQLHLPNAVQTHSTVLITADGRKTMVDVRDQTVEVSHLPAGHFFIQYLNENGYLQSFKFVKQE